MLFTSTRPEEELRKGNRIWPREMRKATSPMMLYKIKQKRNIAFAKIEKRKELLKKYPKTKKEMKKIYSGTSS